MIHPSIQPHLPKVFELFEQHKIKNAYLFGSVLTSNFNEDSDVDFLVNVDSSIEPAIMGGHLWDLIYELQDLLNRHIDLLTERSLKNPYFIQQINNAKLPIYGF